MMDTGRACTSEPGHRSTATGVTAARSSRGRSAILAAAALAITTLLVTPFGAAAQDASPSPVAVTPGAVTLVAYSTPREAYEEIIPLFQATEAGAGIEFEQSYSGSGDQSRAVEAGLPADLVALSLWPDVERLVEPGLIAADWDENEYQGIVHDSVVVFVVRPGNPKGIADWDDLIREDVDVITPNPFTSGGAQWNILAAYQAQLEAGKTEDEALDYLKQLIANTSVMDRSARESLATFMAGQGDVMIGYENEAIFAQQMGQPIDFVIPESSTMLIENPVAVTTVGDALQPATAFVDFLYSPEAQRVFGQKGFRPVVQEILAEFDYPEIANLFTIEDLGGWAEARPRFFDPDTGIVAGIFSELGRDAA
jgi:sulfate/thiosulfate transport system substrate-binding protein